MDIPGRRKKDGPGKTVIEMYLYLVLERNQAFLCEEICRLFRLSERTLFRYMKELKTLCPDADIHSSGRVGRKEFILDGWLDQESVQSFPEDPHLGHLARLLFLYHLVSENAPSFFYPDEFDEPVFASDLTETIKKAGFPALSLRTLQRDLKEICDALDLYDLYNEDF